MAEEYTPTDLDRSMQFVAKYRDRVRWIPQWRQWYCWTGKRWEQDDDGMQVQEFAKTISPSNSAIKNLLQLAKSTVVISPEDLDAHPRLLNTPSGLVNLDWSPQPIDYNVHGNPIFDEWSYLSPHDPTKYCTKITGVKWAPQETQVLVDAATDTWVDLPDRRWDQFLERVQPDPEIRRYLQRWAGYMLCGEIREHEMLVLEGDGANGKSVFISVLLGVLGDYAAPGAHSLLIEQRNEEHPTALAATKGLRMCVVAETPQRAKVNEHRLSQLTGGDQVQARRMHQDFWSFTPTAKLVMVTNHRPEISTGTEAIWRRIRRVPWPVTIPTEERILDLAPNLIKHEGAYVLDWMFNGWFIYKREGLQMPESLIKANDLYRIEQDVIAQFMDEMGYVTGSTNDLKVSCSDFNYGLDAWCQHSGMQRPTRNERTRIMEKKGFIKRNNKGWHWYGLAKGESVSSPLRGGGRS